MTILSSLLVKSISNKVGGTMQMQRDCVFYIYDGNIDWDYIDKPEDKYVSISCSNKDEVIEGSIKWIDSIRIKEKIIATSKKQVHFSVYESRRVICIFGNSESQLSYVVGSLMNTFRISLNKIKIFEFYKNYFIKNLTGNSFKLTSLDISKTLMDSYINVPITEFKTKELKNIFTHYHISALVITDTLNNMYFVIDSNSVVSFFETDELVGIKDICKRIVNENV